MFDNTFTDVDRQTELNDDDGSLSGLRGAVPAQFADNEESTVSVNTDSFFYAPVQALECVSELTCLQSPYDYMSAVVFPECAASGGGGCGVSWSSDATTRSTYGVPVYRQYLIGQETAGASQSIRMLGAGIYQRSTLIANKGKYYVDTTVSQATQSKTASLFNVFQPGGTYNFFFLYARPTSVVTYQLYVGTGLNSKTFLDNNVKMIRAGSQKDDGVVLVNPLEFTPVAWMNKWHKAYDSTSGILTVSLDFSAFQSDFEAANAETCGPASYCEWILGKCVDKKGSDSICKWAVKAFECPSGGCPGFQVTLPSTFVADDDSLHHRPTPEVFTKDFANVHWLQASPDVAGKACSATPVNYDPFMHSDE
jgi:hypothetical protein